MNKRIDELWGKALDKAVPDTYSSLTWTQVEKIKQVFAELIVRECIDILPEKVKIDDLYDGKILVQCGMAIKEHFGVEE